MFTKRTHFIHLIITNCLYNYVKKDIEKENGYEYS